MNVYLYFVAICIAGMLWCGGMALGMYISEKQYKKHEKENNRGDK